MRTRVNHELLLKRGFVLRPTKVLYLACDIYDPGGCDFTFQSAPVYRFLPRHSCRDLHGAQNLIDDVGSHYTCDFGVVVYRCHLDHICTDDFEILERTKDSE